MSPTVSISGRKIGIDYAPYVLSEISGNHLRSKERARMLFSEAKRIGVEAIKIQTYTPESLAIEISRDRIAKKPQWKEAWGWNTGDIFNLYRQVYTPRGEFTDYLFALGREFGITVFSTPFSVDDVRYLAEKFDPPAYKIAALEYDFFPLLDVIAQTRKPIIMNVCVATLEKIKASLKFLERAKSGPVILITGPKVYHDDSAKNFLLGRLHALQEHYGSTHVLGLSDHFLRGEYNGTYYQGHEFSVSGILNYGGSFIEKHFCGCRSGLPGGAGGDVDGTASIVSEEMQAMLFWTKMAYLKRSGHKIPIAADAEIKLITQKAMYGYGEKFIGPSKTEIETNEASATRFIYAAHDLAKEQKLTLEDLHFSRAIHHANKNWNKKTPLPTSTVAQVLGNTTNKTIEKGDPIFAENLQATVDLKKNYPPELFSLSPAAAT